MQKILVFLCFLSLSLTLNAQDEPADWTQAVGTLEGFQAGGQYFTFVTDANLREQSNTQSKVVAKLPIGTSVTVVEVSTDSLAQRGIKLPWLKVKCQPNGGAPVTGYVWGGFMALASIQSPNEEYTPNKGVLYLTGVSAYDENKHEITVQVRTALDGKELSKIEFKTAGDLSYYPSMSVDFVAMKNVKAALDINYFYPACGYPSGDNLIFWLENNQMVKVLETTSISDAGVFYSMEEYILPHQRGGIGDHIIVVKDEAEYEEKGDDMVKTRQKYEVTVHQWNGSKLVKTTTKKQ